MLRSVDWRPRPELNRGKRFCRPLRNHSATWPQDGRGLYQTMASDANAALSVLGPVIISRAVFAACRLDVPIQALVDFAKTVGFVF
jgi:hypothetical protein